MKHLTDNTLNDYLDHTSDERSRKSVKDHLNGCNACQTKLEELGKIFAELQIVPEVALKHDLTPGIMNRLNLETPVRIWTRTFAAQAGVASGVLYWLASQLIPFVKIPQVSLSKAVFELQSWFAQLLTIQVSLPTWQIPDIASLLPKFNYQAPTIDLPFSTVHVISLTVTVILLWVVANFILLRSRPQVQR